jgi:hypothetical protein
MPPRLSIATTLWPRGCSSACASPSLKTGVAHEAPRVKPATKTLRFRPTKPALVIVFANDSAPYFQVRLRFNRRLPVARNGVAANFVVGAAGSDDPPVAFGNRTRHCYASSVGNDLGDPALKDAHDGTVVKVSIRIRGQPQIVQHITARDSRHADVAALGCGHR